MNMKFPKSYPLWLKTKDCNKLELDGYNEDLKIAFEYQGEQHYYPKWYIKNPDAFWRQLEYDDLKKKLCKKNGVLLIEIPYEVKNEDIGKYIYYELKKNNRSIPMIYEDIEKIDYKKFNIYNKNKIEEMRRLAELKGGKCLSNIYINNYTKLLWQCEKGHPVWEAASNCIKNGTWCPYCASAKLNIEQMRELAELKGGKCLSDMYVNIKTKLWWQCKNGHSPWDATPINIKQGTWCPYCSSKAKLNIGQMRKLAELKGGKCLSDIYINSYTKLWWQCENGHSPWDATPDKIKQGTWCPYCTGRCKIIMR